MYFLQNNFYLVGFITAIALLFFATYFCIIKRLPRRGISYSALCALIASDLISLEATVDRISLSDSGVTTSCNSFVTAHAPFRFINSELFDFESI